GTVLRSLSSQHPYKAGPGESKTGDGAGGQKQVITWQHFMDRIAQTPVCSICGEPVGPEIRDAGIQQAA
ncbi:MAG: hypothetical protein KUG79_18280, partial [Pseudomonadales bacterium]|nr:hypothetical protein [Pseudomonadales bacterium]